MRPNISPPLLLESLGKIATFFGSKFSIRYLLIKKQLV